MTATIPAWLVFHLIVAFFSLCGAALAQGKSLSVGVVPQFEARKLHAIWQPVLQQVSDISGVTLKLDGAPTIPDFEKDFGNGKFDIAYMNPWHAVIAAEKQGYVPVLRDVGRSLFGILVVGKDSKITTLKQLQDKEIAFPSPNALGASLLMRAELQEKFGIMIVPKYVQTHSSVYLSVALGQTAAGGGVMGTFTRQLDPLRHKLRIIYQTARVAPHPIVVHPRVSDDIRIAIQQAFLALGAREDGAKLLKKVPFAKIGTASSDDYEPLQALGLGKYYVAPGS